MRILVVGATGTIGQAVVNLLRQRHEVVAASRSKADHTVDITNTDSIRALFARVGEVDAVVSVAGSARMQPLEQLSDADFQFSLTNKLMGQVNVARLAIPHVRAGGSITLTSGVLSFRPIPGSAAISLVNSGVEGFVRAAALELPRGIRINAVSPPWVTETLRAYKMEVPGGGRPAVEVATLYAAAVEGQQTGSTLELGAR